MCVRDRIELKNHFFLGSGNNPQEGFNIKSIMYFYYMNLIHNKLSFLVSKLWNQERILTNKTSQYFNLYGYQYQITFDLRINSINYNGCVNSGCDAHWYRILAIGHQGPCGTDFFFILIFIWEITENLENWPIGNIEKETLLRLSYKRDHNGKFFIESKDYASFWFLFHMKQDVDYKVNWLKSCF